MSTRWRFHEVHSRPALTIGNRFNRRPPGLRGAANCVTTCKRCQNLPPCESKNAYFDVMRCSRYTQHRFYSVNREWVRKNFLQRGSEGQFYAVRRLLNDIYWSRFLSQLGLSILVIDFYANNKGLYRRAIGAHSSSNRCFWWNWIFGENR